jgi:polysaccharide pyruvyl transferase WcaK-like protein
MDGSDGGAPLALGLLWHSTNSANLGVGALTVSQIAIIEDVAARMGRDVRFVTLGWADPDPPYVEGPRVRGVGLRMRDLIQPGGKLGAALADCDLVLDIGAGDSFADIYGARRFLMIALSKARALASGKPLVLSPQTFGPFERPWARRIARQLIARARLVATRDALSTAYLAQIGHAGPILEATDVALRLPFRPAQRDGARVRAGVNVSGLLFHGGYTRDNMFGLAADYPALMRSLVARLAARPGVEVHLVGHVLPGPDNLEDDEAAARLIAAETPGVVVAPRFRSPSEAKSYISGLDFFCGARMHACIAALSSGVPVAPMAYSRKFAGLFGTLGYAEGVDLRTQDADGAVAAVERAFENRDALRAPMAAAMAEGQRRLGLYEAALAELFAATGARR